MPFQKKRSGLTLRADEMAQLREIARSRSEPYARVKRAGILLAYAGGEKISAIARREQLDRPVVERCIDKALSGGIATALKDLQRTGRPPIITSEDKAWAVNLACSKPSEHRYAADRWTISKLARHIREHAVENGHPALVHSGKSAVHAILREVNIRPHKEGHYLERRDEQFEEKMAQVLVVYKGVQSVLDGEERGKGTAISYDEKPGIQAIAPMAPDLPPAPGLYATWNKDHQCKRHGTLSLLAGIDLHDGHVLGLVRERHRSKEFIEFLALAHERYPRDWRIRIILDNHSAHLSKETMNWLKEIPNRFEFVYTPKHGSWLNIIEVFFSKMTRAFLRSLRVASKAELKKRIELYLAEVNASPVIFRWKYRLDEAPV